MTLRSMVFLIALAAASCTAQWQLTQTPTLWGEACAAVAERYNQPTCEYREPPVIWNSWLITHLGASGVFVQQEYRIYIAPPAYINQFGWTVERTLYHEYIHAVLYADGIEGRICQTEYLARVMSDEKYHTNTANDGWEARYGCDAE